MTLITVRGIPAPQGSKRAFANKRTGKIVVMEQLADRVKSWRQAVIDAAEGSGFSEGPLVLSVSFYLPRPKGHYRTGKRAGELRESAPPFPQGMPDLDKLLRSTMDALTAAGCWRDDAQVVMIDAAKCYADRILPGATISIKEA